MSQSNCLSKVPFGAFLAYSPKGLSDSSVKSRNWRDYIKRGNEEALKKAIVRLHSDRNSLPFKHFFEGDVVLIPAPSHAPLVGKEALWVPRLIAEYLVSEGLGSLAAPILKRKYSIPKSAYSLKGQRPTLQNHIDSMEVSKDLTRVPSHIVVVDDVVTKGATLLAAASLIKEVYPDTEVSCFALLRTMGMVPEVDRVVEPCLGWITLENGDVYRVP